MQQIAQQLKTGNTRVCEVPIPLVTEGCVLVQTHFSLISPGTEGSTVSTARKSLLGKAKERPQQVRQVVDVLRTQGPLQTYRAVMKKLDAYSGLGYSTSGSVLEIGPGVTEFRVGDLVACAGATANHAEVNCIPQNLCVGVPAGADMSLACYNALGAIALQGIRQAKLGIGESCAVIGLGLVGQLTCSILQASGVSTFGIDVDPRAVATAREHCCDAAWTRETSGLAEQIEYHTNDMGVDCVIITAGSSSLDPINFAGQIARKQGRVVVVGAVPTGFDRDPHYYRKELELRMSCSYGPGRYDPQYEQHGMDYPPAYVRWTEKRNMEAFQQLLHSGRVDIGYLTTHRFSLEEAPDAYDMIVDRTEPYLGIVIQYDVDQPPRRQKIETGVCRPETTVGLAFIGAGSYAQGNLLPHLPNATGIVRRGVLTNSGTTSKRVAERFGFEFCTSELSDILHNERINTVFIATRHDTHAQYVQRCLQAGKHVFVEKPLCITPDELSALQSIDRGSAQWIVGFNRRFAPLAVQLKKQLNNGPASFTYRINAGAVPHDHWTLDPQSGGGRIVGEACHFIDLLTWLNGSLPVRVHASACPNRNAVVETVSFTMTFQNGSIGTIHYFANGSRKLAKERLEVFQSGQSWVLDDFRELVSYIGDKPKRSKLMVQDKGQAAMVKQFLQRIRDGGPSLISAEELFAVSACSFAVHESLRGGNEVRLP